MSVDPEASGSVKPVKPVKKGAKASQSKKSSTAKKSAKKKAPKAKKTPPPLDLTPDPNPSSAEPMSPDSMSPDSKLPAKDSSSPVPDKAGASTSADPDLGPDPMKNDSSESTPEENATKRSRLPWKKKEIPGGLWLKCEGCGQTIYRKELEEKRMVCPSCDFHFTLKGRDRVRHVLDEGSFVEHYEDLTTLDRLQFHDKVPYAEKVERTVARTGQNEALICGLGEIEGRPVSLAVLDFSFLGGSMGEVVGEKISLAADLARKHSRPLVIFTSSGGARMHEGMLSLMQMAKTSAALASLNDAGGFSICVMTNPTTGGVTASFASVCDLTLAEPGALIGFAGPRVIATTLKQELPPGFQRAEFLIQKGQLDAIVHRVDLRSTLASLIDFGRGTWEAKAGSE